MINKKKAFATIMTSGLLAAMAVGGTMAYLTDGETTVNSFTVDDIKIDLVEYNTNIKELREMVPNQEVSLEPMIENRYNDDDWLPEKHACIVFMEVEVPVKELTLVADDGTKGKKEPTEILWFKCSDNASDHSNSWNTAQNHPDEPYFPEWIELEDKEIHGTTDGSTTTYVFGHRAICSPHLGMMPLFTKIQLKNFIENEVASDEVQNLGIRAYAIQARGLLENGKELGAVREGIREGWSDDDVNGTVDYSDFIYSEETLGKIYDIYIKQNENGKETRNANEGILDLWGNWNN